MNSFVSFFFMKRDTPCSTGCYYHLLIRDQEIRERQEEWCLLFFFCETCNRISFWRSFNYYLVSVIILMLSFPWRILLKIDEYEGDSSIVLSSCSYLTFRMIWSKESKKWKKIESLREKKKLISVKIWSFKYWCQLKD